MGRLSALTGWAGLALGLWLSACETPDKKDAPMATNERSQGVAPRATEALVPAAAATPVAVSSAPVARKPRTLCSPELAEAGRAFPKKPISRAGASASELPEAPATGAGSWTWVNFWAAWCAPCKEEIPRLLRFAQESPGKAPPIRVVFVSLDDDERQLNGFFQTQPSAGLATSYWLKEGKEREDWLRAAGVSADSALPFHLLVDPKGKIRCLVQGAIDDADLGEARVWVSKSR